MVKMTSSWAYSGPVIFFSPQSRVVMHANMSSKSELKYIGFINCKNYKPGRILAKRISSWIGPTFLGCPGFRIGLILFEKTFSSIRLAVVVAVLSFSFDFPWFARLQRTFNSYTTVSSAVPSASFVSSSSDFEPDSSAEIAKVLYSNSLGGHP